MPRSPRASILIRRQILADLDMMNPNFVVMGISVSCDGHFWWWDWQQGPTYQHADCLRPEAQVWVVYNNKFQKTNDLFVWNAMWLAFVTMTTVGYGDSGTDLFFHPLLMFFGLYHPPVTGYPRSPAPNYAGMSLQ
jgi:hypothetical protein